MKTTKRVLAAAGAVRIKVTMEMLFDLAVALAYPIGGLYGMYISLKIVGLNEYAEWCRWAAEGLVGTGFIIEMILLGAASGFAVVVVLFLATAWIGYDGTTWVASVIDRIRAKAPSRN